MVWRVNKIGKEQCWYEAELINKLKSACQLHINACNKCQGNPNIDCIDCTQGGKAIMAYNILDIIQENEGCMHQ